MAQCNAEIGRPGNYHGCKRTAKYAAKEKRYHYGDLLYCEAHKGHGTDKRCVSEPGNRYFVLIGGE